MDPDVKQDLSQLMQKVQAGDETAYASLLKEIGKTIVTMIRQRIKDEQIVEDLYQTILLTIHRARHTYDSSRPFKPWLYSITRNTVFDYLRKNRKRFEFETFAGEHYEAPAEQDTNKEELEILQTALNKLPANQREAVTMLKIDGLSLEEAAKKAGVTVGAIKVRAHRGYESLKRLIIQHAQKETV